MTTSDQIHEIAAALAKAQGQMEGAVKDAANPFFKSKYADLASVWDACRKPLTDNGLAVVQSPSADGLRVSVDTLLTHTSGQWMRGTVSVTAKEDSPQAVGSCITYLRRYALQSFAGVAPEDDDAEAAEGRSRTQSRAYVVEAPREARSPDGDGPNQHEPRGVLPSATKQAGSEPAESLSPTGVTITKVESGMGKAKGFLHHSAQPVSLRGSEGLALYDERLKTLAEELCQTRELVRLEIKVGASGKPYVKAIHRVLANELPAPEPELTADSIPF